MIDIFEHPSWGPTSMQIWVGGQNFSFPTLFDSYRELLLNPVLADIFLCHFEEKWLMKSRFCPSLWFRYVDDTSTMFDSKDNANEVLNFLKFDTIASSLPLNSKKTRRFQFFTSFSNAARTTLSLHLSTGRRHSQAFIPSGIYSQMENRELTLKCIF